MIKNNKGQSLIGLLAAMPAAALAWVAVGSLTLFLAKTTLRILADNRLLTDLAEATVHMSNVGRFATECKKVLELDVNGLPIINSQPALECKVDFQDTGVAPLFTNVRFQVYAGTNSVISLNYLVRNPISDTEPWNLRLTYPNIQALELCDSVEMNDADPTKCKLNTLRKKLKS